MRLHDYAASGNCFKVRLLLGLLGRPYERVPVDIFAGGTLTEAFGRLNPLRETPVLELGTGETIAQSGAILWYLADGTAFLPGTRLGRAHVAQWLHVEQERIMTPVGGSRFRLLTGRAEAHDPLIRGRLETARGALGLLDEQLRDRRFLVGDAVTIADLAAFPYVSVADEAGLRLRDWPAVTRWLERVREQPGFVDDFEPYPGNARAGAGRSIYDAP